MRSSRRSVLAGIATGSVTLLAGCQEMVTGDGVELHAEQAIVSESAIDDSIYEKRDLESYEIDHEFEIAGETRRVEASTWISTYTITIEGVEEFHEDEQAVEEALEELEDADVGVFSVVSTPSEEIAGQEINPVSYLSDEDLIDEFGDQVDEGYLRDVESVDEYDVMILGEETTVSVSSATAVSDVGNGGEYEVLMHFAEVANEDDIVLAVGIHHVDLDEQETFEQFMRNIEHPV